MDGCWGRFERGLELELVGLVGVVSFLWRGGVGWGEGWDGMGWDGMQWGVLWGTVGLSGWGSGRGRAGEDVG